MSMNANSIWNFAEKHPFLFYSCVSSIVGGTVKIVRTLKGEPKPVAVAVSDVAADKVKAAVKDAVSTATDKLLEVKKDEDMSSDADKDKDTGMPCAIGADLSQGDDFLYTYEPDVPPEADKDFCIFQIINMVNMDGFLKEAEDYCKLWGNIPIAEIRAYESHNDGHELRDCDYDWGWTAEEFLEKRRLVNDYLILPRAHKL